MCGQCCGAMSKPEPVSPWPKEWPFALRNWAWEDLLDAFPHAQAVGFKEGPDGKVDISGVKLSGNLNVGGQVIKYKIVPGEGVFRITQGQDYCPECPFLLPDPGDGTRPCALYGTQWHDWWANVCDEGPMEGDGTRDGSPPYVMQTQEEVDEWFRRNPLCSFVYVWQE